MDLKDYPQPSVTTDIIIFTIIKKELNVLLIERGTDPYKNLWALPGGFVRLDEKLDEAVTRELREETGVVAPYIEQLYTFGDPKRDPRGRVISVVYFALMNYEVSRPNLIATTDAKDAKWFKMDSLPKLAFDHQEMIDYALKRLRWKFEYTSVAFSMLPKNFTLSNLQELYEIVLGTSLDKRNFRKKILSLNVLKEVGLDKNMPTRPPMLYTPKKSTPSIIRLI